MRKTGTMMVAIVAFGANEPTKRNIDEDTAEWQTTVKRYTPNVAALAWKPHIQ